MHIDYREEEKEMEKYISELRKRFEDNPELAKKESIKSLISSGLLHPDGTRKDEICDRC